MFARSMPRSGSLPANFELWTPAMLKTSTYRGVRTGAARSSSPAASQAVAMATLIRRQGRKHFPSGPAAAVCSSNHGPSSSSTSGSSRRSGQIRTAHEQAQGDKTMGSPVRGGDGGEEEEPFGNASLALGQEVGGSSFLLQEGGAEDEDEDEDEEVESTSMVVARGRKERRDSVTEVIIKERERHLVRLATADIDLAMAKRFKKLSLGTRKRPRQAGGFNKAYDRTGKQVHSDFAAGGFARWMGSASKGWPMFRHRLPEVALAGHTNCGKSTLVNVLSGIHPRKGPASTSDRAGWTDLVGFYQVGKKPPVLTLVDLPGYGHAVATRHAIKGWLRMIKEYITTREELIRCCVLVDCTRGFCEEDRSLLRLLHKRNIPHQIVLTKADLLTPELLSACVLLLRRDLSDLIGQEGSAEVSFSAVCGSSGAGVTTLWKDLANLAAKAPGSLVATQAAHLAARKAREKEEAELAAKKATGGSRDH